MAKDKDQGDLLRDARERLGVTSEELAGLLGVSLPTLQNWLLPEHSARHREMPLMGRKLLAYLLADKKLRKKARS